MRGISRMRGTNDSHPQSESWKVGEAGRDSGSAPATRKVLAYGRIFLWALLITFSLLLAAILLLDAAYYKGIEAFGSLLAAIASVAAVFIAVTSLQVAIRRQREELMQQTQIFSAEFISGLDERFTNMKEVRAAAAKYLLTKPSADISSEEHQRGLNAVAEVLGFFESMAFFARRGVLDKEFVWTHYYLIMLPYWHFFQKLPGMKKP